jgi:hypothetical protein
MLAKSFKSYIIQSDSLKAHESYCWIEQKADLANVLKFFHQGLE